MARNTPRKAVRTTGRGFNSQPRNEALDTQERIVKTGSIRSILSRALNLIQKRKEVGLAPNSIDALKRRNPK